VKRSFLAPRQILAAAAALAVLLAGAPADAQSKDPAAQRREVQRQRAKKASEIDTLKATDAELDKALDEVNANVRSEAVAAARAEDEAERAAAAALAAQEAERRTQAEIDVLRDEIRELAIESYMRGDLPTKVRPDGAASITEVARAQVFIDSVVGKRTDLTDELKEALEDLQEQRARAEEARKAALAREREREAALAGAKDAQSRQRSLSNSASARLDRALAEAAFLEAMDKQLAADLRRQREALATKARTGSSGGGSSSGSRPSKPSSICTVRGINIACDIADNLKRLLDASDGAGLSLGGQGYRSSDGQVATRRANCGTTDYDIYEKPASECHPPTARPGASMHEQGRAVDFTNNGKLVTSRDDPAWQWLKGNAGSYGFYNLPSEPWHWSTNGN
jgi:hypothetical protein